MAQTFTGRKRVRKFFGHIREVAVMPNLIEVQKASYDQFLQIEEPKGGRIEEGLQAVFKSVFPISDFSGASLLEFVRFTFEPPKYDVDECRQRGMTYAAPLKVTLRLIVFDIDVDFFVRLDVGDLLAVHPCAEIDVEPIVNETHRRRLRPAIRGGRRLEVTET